MVDKLDNVYFTDTAAKSMQKILARIEKIFGIKAANNAREEIKKTLWMVVLNPKIGKVYREDMRFVIIRSRTIAFYKKVGEKITVIAVFDARQNWMELL